MYYSKSNQSFFSHIGSGAQRLENGNTLICAMTEGHIFEVTSEGEVVWEFINPISKEGPQEMVADALPMTRAMFRAYRYNAEHPAFSGHSLAPTGSLMAESDLDNQSKINESNRDDKEAAMMWYWFGLVILAAGLLGFFSRRLLGRLRQINGLKKMIIGSNEAQGLFSRPAIRWILLLVLIILMVIVFKGISGWNPEAGTEDAFVPQGFVSIPAGTFEMGDHFDLSEGDHGDGTSDELPLHTVELHSFAMSTYEITNQQYCTFLNKEFEKENLKVENGIVFDEKSAKELFLTNQASEYSSIEFKDEKFIVNDFRTDHPVVCVMWEGAADYCNYLSEEAGLTPLYNLKEGTCDISQKGFRLPTEAEWEYADYGRDPRGYRLFPWGDDPDLLCANWPESNDPFESGELPFTTPVGFFDGESKNKADYGWPGDMDSFQTHDGSNEYGLYDMAGNVWEWCHDWYDREYYQVSPSENPPGPKTGSLMPDGQSWNTLRGGNWYNGEWGHSRASNRNPSYYRGPEDPDHPYYHIGFRPVYIAGEELTNAEITQGDDNKQLDPNKRQPNQRANDTEKGKDPNSDNAQNKSAEAAKDSDRYVNNGDGTVTDKETSLIWQMEEEYDVTIEQATQLADGLSLAGCTDWRVPTMTELLSIVDEDLNKPPFESAMGTSKSEYFWSSDRQSGDARRVWVLNAGGGTGAKSPEESHAAGGEKIYSLKCVRGSLGVPAIRFTDNGNGTVTDNFTRLIWQQKSAASMSLNQAQSYAEEFSLGGYSDWRLPDMKELAMLCDRSLSKSAVNQEYFPSISIGKYWTDSTLAGKGERQWFVDLAGGMTSYEDPSTEFYVLCVK